MNRSCFHANRGYLIGVTVIVLCLLAVLHPGTKARLTFSKEVRPSWRSQSTPGASPPSPTLHAWLKASKRLQPTAFGPVDSHRVSAC